MILMSLEYLVILESKEAMKNYGGRDKRIQRPRLPWAKNGTNLSIKRNDNCNGMKHIICEFIMTLSKRKNIDHLWRMLGNQISFLKKRRKGSSNYSAFPAQIIPQDHKTVDKRKFS